MANEKLTKDQKAQKKLEAKTEKAMSIKADLLEQIQQVKKEILEESDPKKKQALRKKRDTLIAQREAIVVSKDSVAIPMDSKAKKAITAVVAVVIVVALVAAYFATGFAQRGVLSTLGIPQKNLTAYTITDNEGEKHTVKVSTYNFYFAQTYNSLQQQIQQYTQYGMSEEDLKNANMYFDTEKKLSKQERTDEDGNTQSWLDYVQDQVMDQIKSTYAFYYLAIAENDGKEPAITDEQKAQIKEAIDSYKENTKSVNDTYSRNFSLDGYMQASLGQGVTEKAFRHELKVSFIAENYQEEHAEELSKKTYDQKEIDKYIKDNATDLKSVDVKMFECSTADNAKKFKKELKADGSNFAELASKYSDEAWDKEANKDAVETTYIDITRSQLMATGQAIGTVDDHEHSDDEKEDTHKYSGLDWLFSKDRKAGDIKQYSTTVVYVIKPAYDSKQKAVNVRHILITPEKSEDNESNDATACTAKQWADAEKKAKKILKKFKDGKMNSDTFASLAKKNSEDGNASQGGIYEDVYPCQMVPTFNAWCFDSSRKKGDVDIVKTRFGYHIIYFESKSDITGVEAYARTKATATTAQDKVVEEFEISENWLGARFFQDDTQLG